MNNKLHNLAYHQERMYRSIKNISDTKIAVDFDHIKRDIKKLPKMLFKLRIEYNENYFKYTFAPYALRIIRHLKLVYSNSVEYDYKYRTRNKLDALYLQKRQYDDIIIIKENMVTDSYYCNLAFLKDGKWHTPKNPLLKGTKRQQLLDDNYIQETHINVASIEDYEQVTLFNAMVDFGEIIIPTKHIY